LSVSAMGADGDGRRVKERVNPSYPSLARQMNITGMVRLEVVIAANGTVKSTRPLGGHPLLIKSANDAIRKWRYEPGPETTTVVEFRFRNE
jgi:TonB family protein